MDAYKWFSVLSTVFSGAAVVLLTIIRYTRSTAVHDHDLERRLKTAEEEVERLRKWRHEILVPWQQELPTKLEERFLTRREWNEYRNGDSPFPNNRRKTPR